jgi:dihydrofolate reductase
MRKLKLQVQVTIDGFMGGPNGELDFLTWNWSDDIKAYVGEITDPVDTILLGRKLAEGFIPYWTNGLQQPEPLEGAKKFVETPKVVFTKTLTSSPWENTVLAKGDLSEEVIALKKRPGNDMIVYGGGTFVSALISKGLIDEYHFLINPVAIGKGMPLFHQLGDKQELKLVQAKSFDCGIVLLNYTV